MVLDGPRAIGESVIADASGSAVFALSRTRARVIAIHAGNSLQWLAVERAARQLRVPVVPIPPFFSPAQVDHALEASGADCLLTDGRQTGDGRDDHWRVEGRILGLAVQRRTDAAPVSLPQGTARITFTSGSTGTPKGVCLSAQHLRRTAAALATRLGSLGVKRHLCVLPFAILLEEVAGVGTALSTGAELVVPGARSLGFSGDGRLDPERFLQSLEDSGAESLILLPELLKALVQLGESGRRMPRNLRFAAVGGARVDPGLIARARELGLPVYEGYGLSECGSVVAVNTPGDDRVGSAGRPLPHVVLDTAADGRVRVRGASMLGYLGKPTAPAEWDTGDLGEVDEDGFLWISGRRGTRFITSYGRNVSPEWPESLLLGSSAVAQAVVFGESMPACVAVLVPVRADTGDRELQQAVDRANAQLPSYAQVTSWLRAMAPFSPANGQATANGRPRRTVIRDCYRNEVAAMLDQFNDAGRRVQWVSMSD